MNTRSQLAPFLQKRRIASLWVFTTVLLTVLAVSRPWIDEAGGIDIVLDLCGLSLVLIGVFGRLWSTLYIGGRKNHQLITSGPYAVTRNPLYFFSLTAILGVSMMFGSLVVAVTVPLIAFVIFRYTAGQEARYLRQMFSTQYTAYETGTPLFWPKLSLMGSPPEITVTLRALKSTFRDALFIIALLPVMELLEFLRVNGYIATFFVIP